MRPRASWLGLVATVLIGVLALVAVAARDTRTVAFTLGVPQGQIQKAFATGTAACGAALEAAESFSDLQVRSALRDEGRGLAVEVRCLAREPVVAAASAASLPAGARQGTATVASCPGAGG